MSGYGESEEHFASDFNTGFDILSEENHEEEQHQQQPEHGSRLEWEHNGDDQHESHDIAHGGSRAAGDEGEVLGNSHNSIEIMKPSKFEGDILPNEANPNSNYEDDKRHSRPRRTRARGEALDLLKKEFNSNPNLTSQRRKKISESTGLPEKNVRIWFQNRRAKYRNKKGEQRDASNGAADQGGSDPLARYSSPDCLTFFDKIPLNINNNYYFIDICSITVGSWNRMKSGALRKDNLEIIKDLSNLSPISINEIMSNATDLLVLISKKNFEINYFFSAMANNTKILFRIFFPINAVINCSLSLETDDIIESSSGQRDGDKTESKVVGSRKDEDGDKEFNEKFAELKITVSRPPNFAVYFLDASDEATKNQWSICEDFSEGRQVNDAFVGGSNIPHALKGSQSSLKFMNSLILDYNSTNQIIPPPPVPNAHDTGLLDVQPLSLQQQQQPFFDHYDATGDLLNINRGSPSIVESVHQDNINLQETNNTNLLSLPHENHLPSISDFFKNSNELTDNNRWL